MKPCPACQRETQDDLKECPHCGVVFAKWKSPVKRPDAASISAGNTDSNGPRSVVRDSETSLYRNFIIGGVISIGIGWAGVNIQAFPIAAPVLGLFFLVIISGWVLSIYGLIGYARAKGRNAALALILMYLVIATLIYVPDYNKHMKRSRTADTSAHAQMICKTVAAWISAQSKTEGIPSSPPEPSQVGPGGKTFRDGHPSETDWMVNGDEYYRYSVFTDGQFGSAPQNPVVVAEAKGGPDDRRVFGAMVQAGGKGRRSGQDLSGCKSNVEEMSSQY